MTSMRPECCDAPIRIPCERLDRLRQDALVVKREGHTLAGRGMQPILSIRLRSLPEEVP